MGRAVVWPTVSLTRLMARQIMEMLPSLGPGILQSQGTTGSSSSSQSRGWEATEGAVVRPQKVTAQNLRLYLEVEDTALAVRLEQLVDFQQALHHLVLILEELGGGMAFQSGGIGAHKGDPGGPGVGLCPSVANNNSFGGMGLVTSFIRCCFCCVRTLHI